MSKEQLWKGWDYEFRAWISRLQSSPVELVVSKDHSQSYEMERKHIFRLEDNRYAFITEDGCSCYDPSEAKITIFPTLDEAKQAWNKDIDSNSWNERWNGDRLN